MTNENLDLDLEYRSKAIHVEGQNAEFNARQIYAAMVSDRSVIEHRERVAQVEKFGRITDIWLKICIIALFVNLIAATNILLYQ